MGGKSLEVKGDIPITKLFRDFHIFRQHLYPRKKENFKVDSLSFRPLPFFLRWSLAHVFLYNLPIKIQALYHM